MSTDAFTEAAHAEAETVISKTRECIGITVREQERYIEGHVAGAAWARDYLAAQEPTEAEKESAMDALGCELRVVENGQSTCDLHGGYATSDDVCEVVEIALSAARAARREETR